MTTALSDAELNELQHLLEDKRERLLEELAELRADEGGTTAPEDEPSTDAPGDSGDSSVELQQQDTDWGQEPDLQADLAEVEHALSKFAAGTYGLCEQCGQPIPLARLRILPEARYDVQHQAEVEAQGRSSSPA